ncbi:DUF6665 family protein [Phenylobacterium sp.]|uniref:DUF6665 family protein n=1 Tax=Phenylobacterium sp. TaxID=1871053 RepID=UPI0025E4142E|nr:DUF6665 family protein [Phenylobacterium sp.]MBX3483821.1 hypothetical protein [Phenylobacterium sp.]MCW5759727.1 hypothetical protein [Phenylobacterium sp.]
MAAMSSLRMPQSLVARLKVETGEAVLRYELLEEQAHSLGRAGRKVEAALAALREHPGGEGRQAVLKAAADAVWGFLVQREIMGLRDRSAVVAQYGIPREVLARLGAR